MTETDLQDLEYFAAQLYDDARLAELIGMPATDLTAELIRGTSAIARTIIKGRMARETAIRESILDSAVAGSSPAQNIAMDLLRKLRS